MLDSMPISLIAGLVFGFLAGLGIGGGSLLILWLTLLLGFDEGIARAINLMFFITAAGSVCLFRIKKSSLPVKKLLPAIIAGCLLSALTSLFRNQINTDILEKLFGGLLLIIGLKEVFYRPRKAR